MSANKTNPGRSAAASEFRTASTIDEMFLAALERGDDSFETGRMLVTFKQGAVESGAKSLGAQGLRVADARDFEAQAVVLDAVGDADAVVFPEIGVALLGGPAAQERGLTAQELASDDAIASVDPEYFMFIDGTAEEYLRTFAQTTINPGDYLRGFVRAAETIAKDLAGSVATEGTSLQEQTLALGATWGLTACKVPSSSATGVGIKVAILDTGFDVGHPDFAGRPIVSETFVGQPVPDLHSHGTHCTGTACGTTSPPGSTSRYGIASRSLIHIGKVLTNAGKSVGGSVAAGMNWAVANRCDVISMSLGVQKPPQPAYTAAGQSALNNGLLIIAAAGNSGTSTGAPANSPTIFSVAALDPNLTPWPQSDFGKIEIAAPGVDVFSSVPRPVNYGVKTGTSMATPHVAGCAALWAETSSALRGMNLWRQLQVSARTLPFPRARVGAGLVQAP